MRIHFERAGGFAAPAMRRRITVDKDKLPAEEARELQALVDSADIANLAVARSGSPSRGRPDMFHYKLTLEIGGQQHTLVLSDADMPESLRPLINWLTRPQTDVG
jgi:hypothetical protein